jgi:peroxiredoxin
MLDGRIVGNRLLMERRLACAAIVLGLLVVASLVTGGRGSRTDGSSGRRAGDFTLLEASTGRRVTSRDFRDRRAVVLVFLATDCPLSNLILPRLNAMADAYRSRGVTFLGVNSNAEDSGQKVAEHARSHGLRFPVLIDERHAVADQFAVQRTCEILLIDRVAGLRYQGALDDQYGRGTRKDAPIRAYLAEALDALLRGDAVTVSRTEAFGCLIERSKPIASRRPSAVAQPGKPESEGSDEVASHAITAKRVTFSADVAPILQDKCQSCHRPGQAGPFALLTYAQARGHAAMIREVVDEGRMPPWHADRQYGRFANDRSLTPGERATLLNWIDLGAPEGDPKALPPARIFAEGWTIGKPDVVFEMTDAYTVQAEGTLPYQHFKVPTNFTGDRWVQAAEVRPGDRSVVHHIFVRVTSSLDRDDEGLPREPFFAGYVAGDMPSIFPPGTARRVPAGALLRFEVHYNPIGEPRRDRSAIGLIFAKAPPVHQVITAGIKNSTFAIAPGAKDQAVVSSFTFRRDSHLLSMMPHMHLRGKDFRYTATYPDGRTETLLSVPSYDFGWQSVYRLLEPKAMPRGARIECLAHYDNSADNPVNPDPSQTVRWGEQTTDEMMIGYIDYYVDGRMIAKRTDGRVVR